MTAAWKGAWLAESPVAILCSCLGFHSSAPFDSEPFGRLGSFRKGVDPL